MDQFQWDRPRRQRLSLDEQSFLDGWGFKSILNQDIPN